jgi:hypothetical protein
LEVSPAFFPKQAEYASGGGPGRLPTSGSRVSAANAAAAQTRINAVSLNIIWVPFMAPSPILEAFYNVTILLPFTQIIENKNDKEGRCKMNFPSFFKVDGGRIFD